MSSNPVSPLHSSQPSPQANWRDLPGNSRRSPGSFQPPVVDGLPGRNSESSRCDLAPSFSRLAELFAPTDPDCAPTRIAIIEPNRAKATLLAYFLTNSGGFSVVAVEKSGACDIAFVAETKPDVVLAALTPAGFSPGDFIRQIRQAAPSAKLVLLVTECNECLIQAVASAEYHGLVYEPDEDLGTLRQAIASAQRGIRFTSTRFGQGQLDLRSEPRAFSKILSPREQEVLSCVAQSLSDDEIAAQLGCSRNTVLSHRRNLMHKLQIHSLPKLIRYCADKGFTLNPPFFPSSVIRKLKPIGSSQRTGDATQ